MKEQEQIKNFIDKSIKCTFNFIQEATQGYSYFEKVTIRKIMHNNEWWFCVADIVEAFTLIKINRHYQWLKAKKMFDFKNQINKLKFTALDGEICLIEVANVEALFKIIQNISFMNKQKLKEWLAEFGYQNIRLEQNIEVEIKRLIVKYISQGLDKMEIKDKLYSYIDSSEIYHYQLLDRVINKFEF